jgi:hypothetical protein
VYSRFSISNCHGFWLISESASLVAELLHHRRDQRPELACRDAACAHGGGADACVVKFTHSAHMTFGMIVVARA